MERPHQARSQIKKPVPDKAASNPGSNECGKDGEVEGLREGGEKGKCDDNPPYACRAPSPSSLSSLSPSSLRPSHISLSPAMQRLHQARPHSESLCLTRLLLISRSDECGKDGGGEERKEDGERRGGA